MGLVMHGIPSSIEVSSLSVLGELILLDEGSAIKLFSQLCGLDKDEGKSAIRTFQVRVSNDNRWLDRLSQVTPETARSTPELVMQLLTEGFGLYELDAIDVILRLCEQEATLAPAHLLN